MMKLVKDNYDNVGDKYDNSYDDNMKNNNNDNCDI
jgi:hypothetical protein